MTAPARSGNQDRGCNWLPHLTVSKPRFVGMAPADADVSCGPAGGMLRDAAGCGQGHPATSPKVWDLQLLLLVEAK